MIADATPMAADEYESEEFEIGNGRDGLPAPLPVLIQRPGSGRLAARVVRRLGQRGVA